MLRKLLFSKKNADGSAQQTLADRIVPGLTFVRPGNMIGKSKTVSLSEYTVDINEEENTRLHVARLKRFRDNHPKGESPSGNDTFGWQTTAIPHPLQPIDPAHVIPQIVLRESRNLMLGPLLVDWTYKFLVSQKAREIIEAFGDPNLQFIPIELVSKKSNTAHPYAVMHFLHADKPFVKSVGGFKLTEKISPYTGDMLRIWNLNHSDPDNDKKMFLNADTTKNRAVILDVDTSRLPLFHRDVAEAMGLAEVFELIPYPSITPLEGEE